MGVCLRGLGVVGGGLGWWWLRGVGLGELWFARVKLVSKGEYVCLGLSS